MVFLAPILGDPLVNREVPLSDRQLPLISERAPSDENNTGFSARNDSRD